METEINTDSLALVVSEESPGLFATLLQSGMLLATPAGTTIGGLLEALPGFTSEYIDDRVQTIFLNGTATDDLSSSIGGESCVLAITTAMPGLAGAIFRKDSRHAALRTTAAKPDIDSSVKETIVTLKLFNALAKERGPDLLESGITVKTADLISFLGYRPSLISRIKQCSFNGQTLPPEGLCEEIKGLKTIHLRIHI